MRGIIDAGNDAVMHMHVAGVVHRDLKPWNMMETRTGLPVIVDFEIALLDGMRGEEDPCHGHIAGTPSFTTPEQMLQGSWAADLRSDIWSFGAVVYHLYEGVMPLPTGLEVDEVLDAYRRLRPKAMADRRLWMVVEKAMRWEPSERFQGMGEMICAPRECWKDELGTGAVE